MIRTFLVLIVVLQLISGNAGDWSNVTAEREPFKLRENALEIKIRIDEIAEESEFNLRVYDDDGLIGRLNIRFNSTAVMAYKLKDCDDDWTPLSTNLSISKEHDNVLSIFRAVEGLIIKYNGFRILDHCLCEDRCANSDEPFANWQRNMPLKNEIKIESSDTALLRWRAADPNKGNSCKLLNLTNALLPQDDQRIGTSLKVQCVTGFVVVGERNLTCQDNGTWSSSPQCKRYGVL